MPDHELPQAAAARLDLTEVAARHHNATVTNFDAYHSSYDEEESLIELSDFPYWQESIDDVPLLIAEIQRLRSELEALSKR